ncbi:hypothetical protein DXA17_18535 [Ruminococcus sp. AM58-7XD]|nr:hypothetical protein DXA17_18535 [Ruminococcus sp. AM58-7XD]
MLSLYGVKEDFRNLQQNKVFIPYMEWKSRKSKKSFHSQLNIWQLLFPIWSKENLSFHSWQ